MKITVIGTGYVGLSLATLLSQNHEVVTIDIVEKKVEMINSGISPIIDKEIEEFLSNGRLNLIATTDYNKCKNSDFIVISTPTNYDENTNRFNTTIVESAIDKVQNISPNSTIVIKSTVPIGYTKRLSRQLKSVNLLFSPEFLREGKALYDNLYPSRIIVGVPEDNDDLRKKAATFAKMLKDCSRKKDAIILIIGSSEAESVKLFSNSYLATRIAFFNELDTFAETKGLDAKEIINGMCLDPRIGDYYNNPSFGYGGYCLPKDTKQLKSSFGDAPNDIIGAVIKSNDTRKRYVVSAITKIVNENGIIGAYKLSMKAGSDNDRESSIVSVLRLLEKRNKIIVFEPSCKDEKYNGWDVINDIDIFKKKCDVIIANRSDEQLSDVKDKVYCRDLFNRD